MWYNQVLKYLLCCRSLGAFLQYSLYIIECVSFWFVLFLFLMDSRDLFIDIIQGYCPDAGTITRLQERNTTMLVLCVYINRFAMQHVLYFIFQLPSRRSINTPDNNVRGANIGPTWGRQDPGGPHVGPINLVRREDITYWVRNNHMIALLPVKQLC